MQTYDHERAAAERAVALDELAAAARVFLGMGANANAHHRALTAAIARAEEVLEGVNVEACREVEDFDAITRAEGDPLEDRFREAVRALERLEAIWPRAASPDAITWDTLPSLADIVAALQAATITTRRPVFP